MLVSISIAARELGVCIKTLHRWDKKEIIKAYRTAGNHRRYDLEAIRLFYERGEYSPASRTKTGVAAIYARVSSHKQKNDLERQKEFLTQIALDNGFIPRVYADIGSGLNDKRANLIRLIRDGLQGKFDAIYLTYLDRLARFGTKTLIETFQHCNVVVTPVHVPESISFEKALVDDMIALVTSFAGKMHRRRRGKNVKKDKTDEMDEKEKDNEKVIVQNVQNVSEVEA